MLLNHNKFYNEATDLLLHGQILKKRYWEHSKLFTMRHALFMFFLIVCHKDFFGGSNEKKEV